MRNLQSRFHVSASIFAVALTAVTLTRISGAERDINLAQGQWPAAKATEWYSRQPWLAGCNFLPSTAVNDVEMWQGDTFDPATIDRELGWARQLGFNSIRVFLNFVVWQDDAAGLKKRFDQFLGIGRKHGISVMPILFDDCNFADREARTGKQPGPEPGIHNSQWVSSPPLKMVTNTAARPALKRYVKDMVRTFAKDQRVLLWDLYNEPGNSKMGNASLPLVEAAFAWARSCAPMQPITMGVWSDGPPEISRRQLELSDIISFHGYGSIVSLKGGMPYMRSFRRPVICTEWMARTFGSRFESHLPYFKSERIGCWNWGLVTGRIQTCFPWGSPRGATMPGLWFHDILYADGSPFSAQEARFIKGITGVLPPATWRPIVPTSEGEKATWNYTMEQPADDWFKPGFNIATWRSGPAPFGVEESSVNRKPGTVWATADLWARREFTMPADQFIAVALSMHYDEDVDVYINGVLATQAPGFSASYEPFILTSEAFAAIKPGPNVLAAHCRQKSGGQYFDLGINGFTGP
ncbi:MAG: hypothetical protein WCL11_05025 [Verrucomicrobiota bacterium]